jgi:hypothetical protein
VQFRYVGSARASAGGAVYEGDVVDPSHPVFRHDPHLWELLIRRGEIVEEQPAPETAMLGTAETAMRPRARGRRRGIRI